jgi:1-acyl-sn-glycerol-3-phosphate acyltransferase
MLLLRSILFTTLLFLSVPVFAVLIIIARLFGYEAAYGMTMAWRSTVLFLCRALCGLGFRVEGRDNITAEPAVVMLKHNSAYETIAEMAIFPRQCWVLKRELVWVPLMGWAIACLKTIPINRGAGRAAVNQIVAHGTQRLADGIFVMIFPEGTRVRPGESGRYGLSGALLATRAGCPVIPVAHDAGDFWPRRGMTKRPGTITFRIGPPIATSDRDPREITAEVREWIESAVADIRRKNGRG